jgi:hypothetical protein
MPLLFGTVPSLLGNASVSSAAVPPLSPTVPLLSAIRALSPMTHRTFVRDHDALIHEHATPNDCCAAGSIRSRRVER